MGVVFHPSGRQSCVPTEIFWTLNFFPKRRGRRKVAEVFLKHHWNRSRKCYREAASPQMYIMVIGEKNAK